MKRELLQEKELERERQRQGEGIGSDRLGEDGCLYSCVCECVS